MAYGQKLKIKIGLDSVCYGPSDLKLAKQSDRGKGVQYVYSGLMYVDQ